MTHVENIFTYRLISYQRGIIHNEGYFSWSVNDQKHAFNIDLWRNINIVVNSYARQFLNIQWKNWCLAAGDHVSTLLGETKKKPHWIIYLKICSVFIQNWRYAENYQRKIRSHRNKFFKEKNVLVSSNCDLSVNLDPGLFHNRFNRYSL